MAVGATGPIASRRAAYRVDLVWNKTGGYIRGGGSDTLALNGAVDVKLESHATVSFAMDHFRDDYGASYFGTPLVPRDNARDASDLVNDSRGWVLDESLRKTNYNVDGGIADIDTTRWRDAVGCGTRRIPTRSPTQSSSCSSK